MGAPPTSDGSRTTSSLDLHRGYSAGNLRKVALKPWAERGISAVFYDMIGAESLAGMYVAEIAPGALQQARAPALR